jgi:hypothetical protein
MSVRTSCGTSSRVTSGSRRVTRCSARRRRHGLRAAGHAALLPEHRRRARAVTGDHQAIGARAFFEQFAEMLPGPVDPEQFAAVGRAKLGRVCRSAGGSCPLEGSARRHRRIVESATHGRYETPWWGCHRVIGWGGCCRGVWTRGKRRWRCRRSRRSRRWRCVRRRRRSTACGRFR